jgi:NADH-quinone oxidoreductase subunit E
MTFVATSLGLSPAKVFGVASFYAHFALQAKGKYVLRLCDGTACHVKGSEPILEVLGEKLGLSAKKPTTTTCSSPLRRSLAWAPAVWRP